MFVWNRSSLFIISYQSGSYQTDYYSETQIHSELKKIYFSKVSLHQLLTMSIFKETAADSVKGKLFTSKTMI